ncbi:MAG: methyltransferase domain-containing protein [Acidimicrobiaceae bacterium]|nr:methyltransferase domain-containing protein [Acidimicrobiaceae bacterium]
MDEPGYASTWTKEEDLESLNLRIHDAAPIDQLANRARGYRDLLFGTFPEASPKEQDTVVEFGSGVGWIMEAMLERFSMREIVGLDISENMITRAQERFQHPRARFVHYDGLHIPFEDGEIQVIYSCAAIQHIEKHVAFMLLRELHRVLAAGGHAVLHLLSVEHIPHGVPTYDQECLNHINNVPTHWHHYYSFDELFILLSKVIGVRELDIVYKEDLFHSLLVHFGKGTGRLYRRPELPQLTFASQSAAVASPAARSGSQRASWGGRLRRLRVPRRG